jgi:hypothetical protein
MALCERERERECARALTFVHTHTHTHRTIKSPITQSTTLQANLLIRSPGILRPRTPWRLKLPKTRGNPVHQTCLARVVRSTSTRGVEARDRGRVVHTVHTGKFFIFLQNSCLPSTLRPPPYSSSHHTEKHQKMWGGVDARRCLYQTRGWRRGLAGGSRRVEPTFNP